MAGQSGDLVPPSLLRVDLHVRGGRAGAGEDIRVGGKALLLKIGDVFHLFVLSAALKFDSSAVERRFGVPPLLVQRG